MPLRGENFEKLKLLGIYNFCAHKTGFASVLLGLDAVKRFDRISDPHIICALICADCSAVSIGS